MCRGDTSGSVWQVLHASKATALFSCPLQEGASAHWMGRCQVCIRLGHLERVGSCISSGHRHATLCCVPKHRGWTNRYASSHSRPVSMLLTSWPTCHPSLNDAYLCFSVQVAALYKVRHPSFTPMQNVYSSFVFKGSREKPRQQADQVVLLFYHPNDAFAQHLQHIWIQTLAGSFFAPL